MQLRPRQLRMGLAGGIGPSSIGQTTVATQTQGLLTFTYARASMQHAA